MFALVTLLAIFQSLPFPAALVGRAPLIDRKLPFSPIEQSEMVVTGGGDGLGLNVFPTIEKAFDPNKEMPDFQTSSDGQTKVIWKPTPSNYIISEEVMLRVTAAQNGENRYHSVQAIRYSEKKPWAMIDHIIILSFDHKVFAMCLNELGDDEGPGEHSDAILIHEPNGRVELDIGQYMSGTGAFNTQTHFEISAKGPKLIEITAGGRDH